MARRAWSEAEETLLLWLLTIMVQSTMWNTEAGTFHPGYLNYPKGLMVVEFPDAGMEEYHSLGKIKWWKRICRIIVDLIHVPGFDWDPTQHEVVAEDDVWDAYIKGRTDKAHHLAASHQAGKTSSKSINFQLLSQSCRFNIKLTDSIAATTFACVRENMFRITAQYLKDNMDEDMR
ncbi:hypothetical protein RHMOL_Rhmol04G0245300 [Rhododendron molle]|uniref:Uncharacterized protein n=1 Tax=Rhododendron molle TaxID=49168 RepID=A0ACC0P443_RHOML|nr:hypothetical protein RHMOL_Rhmol04G0245300 [Rhododendron molle]